MYRMLRPAYFTLLVALLAFAPGCSRKHFRQRADKDVAGVITQKNVFPEWEVKNWHVYPDPRARFADPSNPDRPPYPPDDYAARVLSPNPQRPTKKSGAGRFEGHGYLAVLAEWDAANRATAALEAEQEAAAKDGPPAPGSPPVEKLPPPKSVVPEEPTTFVPDQIVPFRPVADATMGGQAARATPPATGPGANAPRSPEPVIQWVRQGAAHEPPAFVGPPAEAPGKVVAASAELPAVTIPIAQPPAADGPKEPNPPAPFPAREGGEGSRVLPPSPDGGGVPEGPSPATDGDPATAATTTDPYADILDALRTDEAGFLIRMEQAVALGLLNSREFQDRREDLYLAALPVTTQRFSFAAQGFFTQNTLLDFAGRALGRTPRNRGQLDTATGFSKLFPTGALLAVRLANQVVVDLTGDRPAVTVSNLALNLAQPFLRGGGYAVTLEPLTLAERNMLYAVRSYARFRKLYYVAVTVGGNITNNPYGLQGLSVNLGRGIGGNLTAPSVGYLPLLLQSATIANQKRNVAALEALLRLFVAFREGGQQSDLQVSQVEQSLLRSRTDLLGSANANGGGGGIRGFLDARDNFKLQLGVPLTVGLEFDDTPLKPVRVQLARFDAVYADLRGAEEAARQFDPAAPVAAFRPFWRNLLTASPLVRGTPFADTIRTGWAGWESLSDDGLNARLEALQADRRALLERQAARLAKGQPEPPAEAARLAAVIADLDLGTFEQAVRRYEAEPWRELEGPARPRARAAAFRDVYNGFFLLILGARNERLERVRGQWPDLPPVVVNGRELLETPLDDAYTAGIQAALANRLDLMNARGQVVDSWRQIKVQANSLLGVFDVEYNLGSSTPPGGTNPAAFSGPRTSHGLTFRTELPLIRRVERNNYRAALIGYQRQRRTLMSFEDNIANDVRGDIRLVRTIAELYRVQQRLVELGYSQVDNAQALLLQPPAPGAQADAGSAAALTRQVLDAQSSLVNAQNSLYSLWVSYAQARMTLYLDLELMRIDERGEWIDEYDTGTTSPDRLPAPGGDRLPAPGGDRLPAPGRE